MPHSACLAFTDEHSTSVGGTFSFHQLNIHFFTAAHGLYMTTLSYFLFCCCESYIARVFFPLIAVLITTKVGMHAQIFTSISFFLVGEPHIFCTKSSKQSFKKFLTNYNAEPINGGHTGMQTYV